MGIHEKLIGIQNELKAPKNQYNSFGKYHYRNCEDILESAKPIIKKYNASLVITDEIVLIGDRYYVKATATLTDTETGEVVTNSAYARESESQKGMDSSQLTGATSSYARKYALNGLFLIDDTKDADTDEYKKVQDNSKKSTNPAKEVKSEEQLNKEMVENTDKDLTPHGEGMTPVRLAKLEKAMQFTGKNKATVLATAKVKSFEEMTEATYISIMNLFGKLMTPEQKAEIEAIQ